MIGSAPAQFGEQPRADMVDPDLRLVLDQLQMEVGRVSAMSPLEAIEELRAIHDQLVALIQ
jgi:hypothetical protein